MASDSDCFSKATVSTRWWTPAWTRLVATMAVEPPTEPAVWTRSIGLPTAPSASARYSSGIITPSKKSGALPIDDGVDVGPASCRRRPAPRGGLPDEPGDRHVAPGRLVVGLAEPDDGHALLAPSVAPSRTHTRFCCRQGPQVAWATARPASPRAMRAAASPMRTRPAAIIGLAASGPPDGLTSTSSFSPRAWRTITSWWVNGAWSSATSTGRRRRRPARRRGRSRPRWSGPGRRGRGPRCGGRCPGSTPGRSASSRARSPAARTTAAAPSLIGGQSCRRSGATISGSASSSPGRRTPGAGRAGCPPRTGGCGRRSRPAPRAGDPGVEHARAWRAARLTSRATAGPGSRGRAGGTARRAARRARTCRSRRRGRCRHPGLDLDPGLVQRPGRRPSRRGSR